MPSVASRTTRNAAWLESSRQLCASNSARTLRRSASLRFPCGENTRPHLLHLYPHGEAPARFNGTRSRCFAMSQVSHRSKANATPVDFKRHHYHPLHVTAPIPLPLQNVHVGTTGLGCPIERSSTAPLCRIGKLKLMSAAFRADAYR